MIIKKHLYRSFGYIRTIVTGLLVTTQTFIKGLSNIKSGQQTNIESLVNPRGRPILTLQEDGSLKCNGCGICAANCPANCIYVVSSDESVNEKSYPISFSIELLRCIFCGKCQEVCPLGAIKLSQDYCLADYAEVEWVLDHNQLSKASLELTGVT